MADEIKKLKRSMDKEFLGFKANQLGKTYKSVKDYLTDNGANPVGGLVYNRRVSAYNTYAENWKTNLNEAGIQSGKLLPEYQKQIEKMYPALAAYMNQYPELQSIFRKAVTSPVPVSVQVLNAQMRGTSFWQTLTDSRVAYDTATEASKQQMRDQMSAKVTGIAQNVGITFDPNEQKFQTLVVDAVREGWTDAMLGNAIGRLAVSDSEDVVRLREGLVGTKVNQALNQWGYPISGDNRVGFVNEWTAKIATGAESTETLNTYLKDQAKQWYPSFSQQFDNGLSFKDVVSPYASIAASTLEMDANNIDWTNPIYSRALNQGPEKNNAPMSFADWSKALRTDEAYGWNSTQQANDLARQIGATFARAFGKVK